MIGPSKKCKTKNPNRNPMQINLGDLEIVRTDEAGIMITAASHCKHIICEFSNAANQDINIVVGASNVYVDGSVKPHTGTIVLLTQYTDSRLVLQAEPGVSIVSPGLLESYGKGSTITLVSISEYEWVLGGDVDPNPIISGD